MKLDDKCSNCGKEQSRNLYQTTECDSCGETFGPYQDMNEATADLPTTV